MICGHNTANDIICGFFRTRFVDGVRNFPVLTFVLFNWFEPIILFMEITKQILIILDAILVVRR